MRHSIARKKNSKYFILQIRDTTFKCGELYAEAVSTALGGAVDDLLELVGL